MGEEMKNAKLVVTSDGICGGCSACNKGICIMTNDLCDGCSSVDVIDLDDEE